MNLMSSLSFSILSSKNKSKVWSTQVDFLSGIRENEILEPQRIPETP